MATPTNFKNAPARARVGGSGYTTFCWDSGDPKVGLHPIGYARQISHQSPTPVGPGTVPIHPMDTPYPVELITPQATTMGTLTLEFYELFHAPVWRYLGGLQEADLPKQKTGKQLVDLAGIFNVIANMDTAIRIVKVIRSPKGRGGVGGKRFQEYNNCVISQLMDGETIEVGTMEVLKQIVVNYTHVTESGRNFMLVKSQGGNFGTTSDVYNDGFVGSTEVL